MSMKYISILVLFLYYTFLISKSFQVNAEFNHKLIDAAIEEFIDIDTEYKDLVFNNTNPFCYSVYNRCLPYFFIVGTFKSGTTSLYRYLGKHPQIELLIEGDTVQEQKQQSKELGTKPVKSKEVGFF